MRQKTITITIRVAIPDDTSAEDQRILADHASEAVDDALEKAGIEGAVVAADVETPTRLEDMRIEEMPTIQDLLDDDNDEED